MRIKRNLTRYRDTPLTVRNLRIAKYWKRKLVKNWINNEFD